MDWIKVKVKHAEYDFAGSSDNIFRAWIMTMIYVAAIERKPLRNALCKKVGENNVIELENWLKQNDIKLDTIIDKVLEDVEYINNRKAHTRKYMRKYRSKTLRNKLHKSLRKRKEKRREEKIREDNTNETFLCSLRDNPVYKHIDIEHELGKMDGWLLAHKGRKKTRRFIINWLNKIEKPLSPTRRFPS